MLVGWHPIVLDERSIIAVKIVCNEWRRIMLVELIEFVWKDWNFFHLTYALYDKYCPNTLLSWLFLCCTCSYCDQIYLHLKVSYDVINPHNIYNIVIAIADAILRCCRLFRMLLSIPLRYLSSISFTVLTSFSTSLYHLSQSLFKVIISSLL